MRRRRRRKEKWGPPGLPYIGREYKSHDQYHQEMAEQFEIFDALPDDVKENLRLLGGNITKAAKQWARDEQTKRRNAERAEQLENIRKWREENP